MPSGDSPSIVVTSAPSTVETGVWHERTARAVEVHGARAALADAAAELRALEVEHVAQHPEQRHVRRDVHRRGFPVDLERVFHLEAGRVDIYRYEVALPGVSALLSGE